MCALVTKWPLNVAVFLFPYFFPTAPWYHSLLEIHPENKALFPQHILENNLFIQLILAAQAYGGQAEKDTIENNLLIIL